MSLVFNLYLAGFEQSVRMECQRFRREELSYENLSRKYRLGARDFSRQYAHIYFVRLAQFRPILEERVAKKWGSKYEIKKLADVVPNEKVVVIGIVYKQQELKPSILREMSEEHQLPVLPPNSRHVSPNDSLILEDELQRVVLAGSIKTEDYVTGVVLALLGYEDNSGKFQVEEVCNADLPLMKPPIPDFAGTRYVAFISGLDLGGGNDQMINIQEMVYALTGKSGVPEFQKMMSRISRLIIAGDSLSSATQDRGVLDKARYLLKNNMAASIQAIQILDDVLFQLVSSVPVDIMPGAQDPANFVLPQQPLHHCMFPQSSQMSTFSTVSNPYCCRIGGRLFLGTSGQPISDIWTNSQLPTGLTAMEKTLEWRHLCPTAPDTLGCYPYADNDPFILDVCPDVYFAGNQSSFGDHLWTSSEGHKVRLISIPRFSETATVVLLDVETLECQTLSFGTEDLQ